MKNVMILPDAEKNLSSDQDEVFGSVLLKIVQLGLSGLYKINIGHNWFQQKKLILFWKTFVLVLFAIRHHKDIRDDR